VSAPGRAIPWIADLDKLDDRAALAALAPLFEGAPRFLGRLIAERPFWSWDRLFVRAREIAQEMPQPEQVELLDAHPRLGAPADSVSALSSGEQGYDQAGRSGPALAEPLASELARLNAAYEARFGFRYCVFVAGRPLADLVPGLAVAVAGERNAELVRGLDAVVDIAIARERALAGPEGAG
jgi:2-oxo-4-hydroxy-4-carboxy--5-ureidoimidazoline (OHCU) decarboxylase